MRTRRRIAVVGAGWAGLSAAVCAVRAGSEVHLFEMSHRPGGRARSLPSRHGQLDNGQHILIGACREALGLMRVVGVDVERALLRCPLDLRHADQTGLALPLGASTWDLLLAVLTTEPWNARERAALALTALRWRLTGFRCDRQWTVERLVRHLPRRVRDDLVEPLCVAALNTPVGSASASVFLRVIRDALFGGLGSTDLLLPRVPLSDLLAEPALAWLVEQGATVCPGHRVLTLESAGPHWRVDAEPFDGVVLATSAREAARLTGPIDREWSRGTGAITFQPIVTAWLHDAALKLPRPMIALRCADRAPAQFAFDLGALGGPAGYFAFVVSGAAQWVGRGLDATAEAIADQARRDFPGAFTQGDAVRHLHAEQRATFDCVPGIDRPPSRIAAGLQAAGDYIDGPYPSTLEGAVRSGQAAAHGLGLAPTD